MATLKNTLKASVILINILMIKSWVPDTKSKLYIKYDQEKLPMFFGNTTYCFKLLDQDENTLLIGARNAVYNISLNGLIENSKQRIDWFSSEAHREICAVKGKQETDCLNYIRVYAKISDTRIMICGTNAYKPLCQEYIMQNGKYQIDKEYPAQGICPYSPEHNSTYIYTDGQLYSATVADFSGADPLIYREGQRTEQYDLKQLNQPDFISTLEHNGYVFFFFREIAMEFMNCGKAIYSRVGRVCKNDKGGPYQFSDRWTSFLKTRLNCSVPGDYPFYFDEIQATTKIIEGLYTKEKHSLIYAVFTTPQNAISGSAVCAFRLSDILDAFEGRFKGQRDKDMNSNWYTIPADKVPSPRPGTCVDDSRTLPSISVNFVKHHPLMEQAVPPFFDRPLFTRVSLQYRFTSITVDPQIESLNGEKHDVIFVGTDDGRVIKFINILSNNNSTDDFQTNVISEVQALPVGVKINELTISHKTASVIAIGNGHISAIPLFDCSKITRCNDCLQLQDPYCIWDIKNHECKSNYKNQKTPTQLNEQFVQDIRGNLNYELKLCKKYGEHDNSIDQYGGGGNTDGGGANGIGHISQNQPSVITPSTHGTVSSIGQLPHNNYYDTNEIKMTSIDGVELANTINNNNFLTDPISKGQLSESSNIQVSTISYISLGIVLLLFGIFIGFGVSKYKYFKNQYHNHENHNDLNWSAVNKTRHTFGSHHPLHHHQSPPRDKDINLLMNVHQTQSYPAVGPNVMQTNLSGQNQIVGVNNVVNTKIDNLEHEFVSSKDRSHECKNSNESLEKELPCKGGGGVGVVSGGGGTGTLQKVKKTYI